jgi:hypothetical protein
VGALGVTLMLPTLFNEVRCGAVPSVDLLADPAALVGWSNGTNGD